jgi:hypothetical protein
LSPTLPSDDLAEWRAFLTPLDLQQFAEPLVKNDYRPLDMVVLDLGSLQKEFEVNGITKGKILRLFSALRALDSGSQKSVGSSSSSSNASNISTGGASNVSAGGASVSSTASTSSTASNPKVDFGERAGNQRN